MLTIEAGKFTDHPVRVGGDPNGDGEVMAAFGHILPRSPGDHDGNDQGWKDHRNPQWPPNHAPGHIFKKPKYDMEIFHFAVA